MPDFMKAAHRSYAHMMAINNTIEETVGILPFKAEAAAALGKELANQLNQMKKQTKSMTVDDECVGECKPNANGFYECEDCCGEYGDHEWVGDDGCQVCSICDKIDEGVNE